MRGYELIKIDTKEDAKRADMAFVLDTYEFEELKGTYVDGAEKEFEPVGRERVTFAIVVHDRLYLEQVEAYRGKDGKLYATEEQIEELL